MTARISLSLSLPLFSFSPSSYLFFYLSLSLLSHLSTSCLSVCLCRCVFLQKRKVSHPEWRSVRTDLTSGHVSSRQTGRKTWREEEKIRWRQPERKKGREEDMKGKKESTYITIFITRWMSSTHSAFCGSVSTQHQNQTIQGSDWGYDITMLNWRRCYLGSRSLGRWCWWCLSSAWRKMETRQLQRHNTSLPSHRSRQVLILVLVWSQAGFNVGSGLVLSWF